MPWPLSEQLPFPVVRPCPGGKLYQGLDKNSCGHRNRLRTFFEGKARSSARPRSWGFLLVPCRRWLSMLETLPIDPGPPRTRPLSGRTSPRFQRRPAGKTLCDSANVTAATTKQALINPAHRSSSKFCSGCSCLSNGMQVRGLPCCSAGQTCLLSTYSRPAKERTAFHGQVTKRAATLNQADQQPSGNRHSPPVGCPDDATSRSLSSQRRNTLAFTLSSRNVAIAFSLSTSLAHDTGHCVLCTTSTRDPP